MQTRLITVADVASRLGLSRSTAYDFVNRLPSGTKVRVGQLIRVDEDALNRWIASGGDDKSGKQE